MSDGIMLTAGMDFSNGEDCTMLTLIVDGKPDHVSCDTPWGRAVVDLLSDRDEAADELARLRAEVERLRAALADERAHADALAEAVEMFATDRNWLQGGPFDPCSPSFTGTSMASAVAKQHRARRQG